MRPLSLGLNTAEHLVNKNLTFYVVVVVQCEQNFNPIHFWVLSEQLSHTIKTIFKRFTISCASLDTIWNRNKKMRIFQKWRMSVYCLTLIDRFHFSFINKWKMLNFTKNRKIVVLFTFWGQVITFSRADARHIRWHEPHKKHMVMYILMCPGIYLFTY